VCRGACDCSGWIRTIKKRAGIELRTGVRTTERKTISRPAAFLPHTHDPRF
jgi:hypothetical protein